MNTPRMLSVLLLAACGASADKASLSGTTGGTATNAESDEALLPLEGLRLDVVPTELPASVDAVTALPQSFQLPPIARGLPFDAGTFAVEAPVEISGSVVGPDVAGLVPMALLPGEDVEVAIDAEVRLTQPGTLQSYRATTDADGALTMFVMPGADYVGTVVPALPGLPLTEFAWSSSEELLDLTLDYGAPVYGRVLAEGDGQQVLGLGDVVVRLVTQGGVRSAPAISDPSGFFHITAAPGRYTLVCEGRAFGQDPVLTVDDVDVVEGGLAIDFAYPTIEGAVVDGRVLDEQGEPIEDVGVRLTAVSIDQLESERATFETEKRTDADGGFLARLPPGIYDVEFLPTSRLSGEGHTPLRLGSIAVADDTSLGRIEIAPTVPVDGTVSDDGNARVASAVVSCREVGFGGRSWTAVSDEDGRFRLDLPQAPLACAITPPADRRDLALTRRTFDPAENQSPTLRMTSGQEIRGQVARDGVPEPYVVLEVRDALGELLGSALSDEDGAWAMRVSPQ